MENVIDEMNTDDLLLRLESRGVKPTANRILVLKALSQQSHPVSMAEIEDRIVTLDKSSIFRVLSLFLAHDLVHAIEDGSGSLKYELCMGEHEHTVHDQHIHFYCETCHQTFCIEAIPVPIVELPEGFVPHAINYIVKGVCPKCQRG